MQQKQITMDANGNGIAVWTRGGVVYSNRFEPATGWGAAQAISASGALSPEVAADANGNAIAVWCQLYSSTFVPCASGGFCGHYVYVYYIYAVRYE